MKKLILHLLVFFMITLSAFAGISNPQEMDNHAFAEESSSQNQQNEENISIFIRQPTHSVFLDEKLYFIDESDGFLKVYDNSNDAFLSKYLDLSAFEILDVCFLDDSLYLMTTDNEKNQIHKVDLETLQITTLSDILIENTGDNIYETFFVQNVTFDQKEYTLFTISGFRLAPKLALIDNETGGVLNNFNITFDSVLSTVDFVKVLSWQHANGNAYIIFIYDTTIAYYPVASLSAITDLASNSIQSWSNTYIPTEQARLSPNETIIDVSFAEVNSKEYLSIFYSPVDDAGDFLRLYSFDFTNGIETISYSAEFSCQNSQYAIISQNFFAFPDKQMQKLHFHEIKENPEAGSQKLLDTCNIIENPEPIVDLFDFSLETDDDANYLTTNKATKLFTDPWGATEDVTIEAYSDVVKIGNVSLENGTKINDYVFCLYTFAGKNYCGYVKASDLTIKKSIELKDAGYSPRLKVWPNTRLYSLPTNVTSGQLTNSTQLISKTIMQIEDNYEVEVLDVICKYTADETTMIKVKVNGEHIGYIEEKCIRNPSKVIEFVVTNATIQKDSTVVYHNASKDSSCLTFTLNKGKNVRINGKRDTKTGWTSITFNDEYGNEFTGYIETDFIKADAWSTLQIVGCILIAVNIGLLILILMYKKNHLGSHCQKINEDQASEIQEIKKT